MAVITFQFDDVPAPAFVCLIDSIRQHGVEFFLSRRGSETTGSFRSPAGAGTFAHDGKQLSVTILEDRGHFSKLMLKGGLRQLVQEAVELHQLGKQQSAQNHAAGQ